MPMCSEATAAMNNEKPLGAVVVDDDDFIVTGIAEELERWGFRCRPHSCWDGVVSEFDGSNPVALLLVDNALGEASSGVQLVCPLFESGKLEATKVVVFSGYGESLEAADEVSIKEWDMRRSEEH